MKLTSDFTAVRVAAPQAVGECPYCHGSIPDLFAERTSGGKGVYDRVVAGELAIDCYYCRKPMGLVREQGDSPRFKLDQAPSGMECVRRSRVPMQDWFGPGVPISLGLINLKGQRDFENYWRANDSQSS
jgi:hypothetical protein